MAIEKTYLLGKNITLGCGFDLQAKAPLDSRQVVPEYDGLQALIDGNAAYEGMIVYDEGTKKTYQAQLVDGVLAFREFGINEAELKELIASETTAAMEFKGAATALPENPSKGDFYKVTISFDVAEGETAKVGDSIVYDGEQWFIIPSGDDIEDTWRPVTDVDNDSALTFEAGDKLEKTVTADGTITYKHEAIDAPTATPVSEDEQTRTYIASIETDGYGHITGYKTATENVEDTNTTYEFEGLPVGEDEGAPSSVYFQVKSSEEEASEVIYLDAYSKNEAVGRFVAKEAGKSLVSDDEIARLANVDNYDDEEVRGLIDAIDNHSHENKTVLDGITAEKVADWDDAVSKEHTHSFADTDVEDAIAKKHEHTFVEAELNKIADGDVEKWNAAYAHSQVAHAPADAQANVIESVKVNGTALEITNKAVDITIPESTKVEASETNGNIKVDGEEVTVYSHPASHTVSEISDLDDTIKGYDYATKAEAQGYADAKDEAINKKLDANGWSTDEASKLTNGIISLEGNTIRIDQETDPEMGFDDSKIILTASQGLSSMIAYDGETGTKAAIQTGFGSPQLVLDLDGSITTYDSYGINAGENRYTFPNASGQLATSENIQSAVSTKANSADVYAKTETYNKTEIEALLTWGEF